MSTQVVNVRAEANRISTQLLRGEANELAVSFGLGGRIVARGVETKTFKRLAADDEWISKNLIGVYQWGVRKDDIEQDIYDAIEATKAAPDKRLAKTNYPTKRKCIKRGEGRKTTVPMTEETRAAILSDIAERDRLTDQLRTTSTRKALCRRHGTSESALHTALTKDKAAILAGKKSRQHRKITRETLIQIMAALDAREALKKEIDEVYSVAAICKKYSTSKTAVYLVIDKAKSAA
ncbi:MAG TPA: hypothetical protein PK620_14505 [Denitromonas sp.]|nr:hypothetical protein [Denitromonas sp.]HQV16126.1 hypothetical protein [Denitromonas sp.]